MINDRFTETHLARIRDAGVWRFLLSPVSSLVVNAFSLCSSLFYFFTAMRRGSGREYNGFSSSPACLKAFYSVQARNFVRHGKNGVSPTMGNGALRMRRFWYQSGIGVRLEERLGGAVTPILGMGMWTLSNFVWVDFSTSVQWDRIAVIFLALISTNFFGNCFVRQNYNVFAWAVFPIGYYGLLMNNVYLCCFAWSVVSLFSITIFLLAGVLTLLVALLFWHPWLVVTMVPGSLLFLVNSGLLNPKTFSESLAHMSRLLGFVGASKRKAVLIRPARWLYPTVFATLLAVFPFYLIFSGFNFLGLSPFGWGIISLLPAVWFFVNQTRVFRIADAHTLTLLHLSVTTPLAMFVDLEGVALFWLSNSNPLMAMQLFRFDLPMKDWLLGAPRVRPFSMVKLRSVLDAFFNEVPSGSRLLFAFNDPGFNYNAVFDGYSDLYQLALDCADSKAVHALPDWYLVGETSPSENGNIWGRDVPSIRANVDSWNADFVIHYTREGEKLNFELWEESGFEKVTTVKWRDVCPELRDGSIFSCGWISWHLFKLKNS